MHLLMNETGTSPCFIWHDLPPAWTQADSFHRLAEAICHHRVVSLLVGGVRHDEQEPYRLIYRHQHWYLVVCCREPSGVPAGRHYLGLTLRANLPSPERNQFAHY